MAPQKVRILVDATTLANGVANRAGRTGIFTVGRELLRALMTRDDVEVILHVEPWARNDVRTVFLDGEYGFWISVCRFLGRLKAPPVGERGGPVRQSLWLVWRMLRKAGMTLALGFVGRRMRWAGADVLCDSHAFLSLGAVAPTEVATAGLPRYTLFYDTVPRRYPGFYPSGRDNWWWTMLHSLTAEDSGFAISEATRRDFLDAVPALRAEHVRVMPLAADAGFAPCPDEKRIAEVRAKYGIPPGKRYFLSLCTIEPRKNLPFTLKAFVSVARSRDDLLFVLAGSQWKRYADEWERTLAGLGDMRDRVLTIGYVADEDRAALYSGALAFVYLSLYEGFGLPPLEAMQCGCPVLAGSTSSLPEVTGDAGLGVSPDDHAAAEGALARLADDPALRRDLSSRGLARAKNFSWERSAAVVAEAVRKDTLPHELVVSLTTYPARIVTLPSVLEPLCRQTMRPDRIVLWLCRSEFPGGEVDVPASVLAYRARGVEIHFVDESLKPHTKYLFAMRAYPDAAIVTVDDDIAYPDDLVETLWKSYLRHPHAVSAMRAHRIALDRRGCPRPYLYWEFDCNMWIDRPRHALFATGAGGVLYPPHILPDEALDSARIRAKSLRNDDLWLKFAELKAGVPVVVPRLFRELSYIGSTQESSLWGGNARGENDAIVRALWSDLPADGQRRAAGMLSAGQSGLAVAGHLAFRIITGFLRNLRQNGARRTLDKIRLNLIRIARRGRSAAA